MKLSKNSYEFSCLLFIRRQFDARLAFKLIGFCLYVSDTASIRCKAGLKINLFFPFPLPGTASVRCKAGVSRWRTPTPPSSECQTSPRKSPGSPFSTAMPDQGRVTRLSCCFVTSSGWSCKESGDKIAKSGHAGAVVRIFWPFKRMNKALLA